MSIDIEAGKTLIIKLNAIGRVHDDGTRNIYFELNGEPRVVTVRDQSAKTDEVAHEKADPANLKHVGAPMPGKMFKVMVAVGEKVSAGDTLLTTEAMKMETNVKAKVDGVVAEVRFEQGAQIEQGDLLVVLE